jgi:hypothetical protein
LFSPSRRLLQPRTMAPLSTSWRKWRCFGLPDTAMPFANVGSVPQSRMESLKTNPWACDCLAYWTNCWDGSSRSILLKKRLPARARAKMTYAARSMAQKPGSFHILKPERRPNRRPNSQQRTVSPKGAVRPMSSCTRNDIPFQDSDFGYRMANQISSDSSQTWREQRLPACAAQYDLGPTPE